VGRPQVADGGDGHRIWTVAANILNKESRTADRGWSSRFEEYGLTSLQGKSSDLVQYVAVSVGQNNLFARDKHRKIYVRFGTWNVRSLCRTGGKSGSKSYT
jgi:hypothetical protein